MCVQGVHQVMLCEGTGWWSNAVCACRVFTERCSVREQAGGVMQCVRAGCSLSDAL